MGELHSSGFLDSPAHLSLLCNKCGGDQIRSFSNCSPNIFARLTVSLYFEHYYQLQWASPVAQQVKNLPTMQETQEMWVQSLDGEDTLEGKMVTHSSILA